MQQFFFLFEIGGVILQNSPYLLNNTHIQGRIFNKTNKAKAKGLLIYMRPAETVLIHIT